MSEYRPLANLTEVHSLNDEQYEAGYRYGFHGGREPFNTAPRSFWCGWRQGADERGLIQLDEDGSELFVQCLLADAVGSMRLQ